MKIYLAGPIFTYGDLLRNTEWAKKIREAFPDVDLYSPVENTDINGVEGKKKFAGSQEIALAEKLVSSTKKLWEATTNILLVFVRTIVNASILTVKPKTPVAPHHSENSNIVIKIYMSQAWLNKQVY